MKTVFERDQLKYLLLVLLLVFVVALTFFIPPFPPENVVPTQDVGNNVGVDSRITWNQTLLSIAPFTTNEDSKDDKKDVHIAYNSLFSFTTSLPMTKMSFKLVEFTSGVGKPMFVAPSHQPITTNKSYIYTNDTTLTSGEINSSGRNFDYVITNTAPGYYDQVLNTGGVPNLALIDKSIGTIYKQTIIKQTGSYDSSKILQYLGVTAEQLNGKIVFDFEITFNDGTTYKKRFTGYVEGTNILNSQATQIVMQ